ncbi:MAG: hypothetical protein IT334_09550 [Thermomicrobiales bacterium]|nr:hypothetical protein [Thermomicrobiales bacterium]
MDNIGESPKGTIVVLNRDVFFGARLKQLGRDLGYAVEIAPDASAFRSRLSGDSVVLGIIDINARPDWSVIAGESVETRRPPVLAFGPHLDVEGLRAAKAAGVTRVVSNGQFHRDAAELIRRYARDSGPDAIPSEDDEPADH